MSVRRSRTGSMLYTAALPGDHTPVHVAGSTVSPIILSVLPGQGEIDTVVRVCRIAGAQQGAQLLDTEQGLARGAHHHG
jgi:hypothetical protein